MRAVRGAIVALCLATPAGAQEFWPGTTYDPAIPTVKSVLGHDFGEEISSPEEITLYLKALAAAAPDRTRLRNPAHAGAGSGSTPQHPGAGWGGGRLPGLAGCGSTGPCRRSTIRV